MEINLLNRTNQNMYKYNTIFDDIGRSAEKVLKLPKDLEVSVTFVRSRTIHNLNKEYRKIDRPTDVISFATIDSGCDLSCMDDDIGDIFINIDYAKRQAKEYKHSERREIAFLFTHGLLHCLGYDHMTKEDEEEMVRLQKEILDHIVKK